MDDEETTEPASRASWSTAGPNVMLGYAERREDLDARGRVARASCARATSGAFDRDGFFRVTGRTKRIAKVYGLRVNLDEIEAAASAHGPVAVVDAGEQIMLWRTAAGRHAGGRTATRRWRGGFGLNSRAFAVKRHRRASDEDLRQDRLRQAGRSIMRLDELMSLEQYSLPQPEKQAILTERLRELTLLHREQV